MAESSQNTQGDEEKQQDQPVDIKPTLEQPTDTSLKANGGVDGDASDSSPQQPESTPRANGVVNGAGEDDKKHHNDRDSARLDRSDQDQDAQAMVISSLRSQIQDLISQVSQLNGKLVKSYDRVSDLEDDLHVASSNVRTSSLKISQLEIERTQHLSALNTGLLVEKTHVTAELTRLMEKATDEAAQRGQAESARRDIEKDLDDLSAELFGRANSMVAEEKYARYQSEQKLANAEGALKSAEDAVRVMQQQMQTLQAEKEEAALVGKKLSQEKWESVGRRTAMTTKLLSSHTPYQEFLLFVAHLRSIHPTSPQPPAITTLLPLPFLSRILNEDSEPAVRLDLAPSLNWLSRRSVLAAIHNGQLIIEPVSSTVLLPEGSGPIGPNNTIVNLNCALCGSPVFPGTNASTPQTNIAAVPSASTAAISWSASIFKKPSHSATNYSISSSSTTSQPPTPTRTTSHQRSWSSSSPQVYIFRLASQNSTGGSTISIPLSRAVSSSQHTHSTDGGVNSSYTPNPPTSSSSASSSTIYPLCTSNWCLSRLRATCTLWAFVRTGVIEKVWEEEVPNVRLPPTPTITSTNSTGSTTAHPNTGDKPPPIPPRRRGLWGMASSAFGARTASWGEGDSKGKTMTPPPSHPTQAEQKKLGGEQRRLPPPLPPSATVKPLPTLTTSEVNTNAKQQHSVPPPLPKRSQGRDHHPTPGATPALKEKSDIGPGATTVESPLPPPQRPPRRPITPAGAALLESRPLTPPVALNSSSGNATATNGATPNDSPIPPPLPRRAAARRPLADGVASSLSRPSTPAVVVANNVDPSTVVDEIKTEKEDAKKEDEKDHQKEKAKAEASADADANTTETPAAAPSSDESAPPKDQGDEPQTAKADASEANQQQKTEQAAIDAGSHPNHPSDPSSLSLDNASAAPLTSSVGDVALEGEGKEDMESTEKEKETVKESDGTAGPGPVSPPSPTQGEKEEDGDAFVDAETTLDSPVVADGNDTAKKDEMEPTGSPNDVPAAVPPPSGEDAEVHVPKEVKDSKTATTTESSVLVADRQGGGDAEAAKEDAVSANEDKEVQEKGAKEVIAVEAADGTNLPPAESVDGDSTATVAGQKTTNKGEGDTNSASAAVDDGKANSDDIDNNKEAYVGDATWEERTWKELVRLKEEMFWARIGGLRQ